MCMIAWVSTLAPKTCPLIPDLSEKYIFNDMYCDFPLIKFCETFFDGYPFKLWSHVIWISHKKIGLTDETHLLWSHAPSHECSKPGKVWTWAGEDSNPLKPESHVIWISRNSLIDRWGTAPYGPVPQAMNIHNLVNWEPHHAKTGIDVFSFSYKNRAW